MRRSLSKILCVLFSLLLFGGVSSAEVISGDEVFSGDPYYSLDHDLFTLCWITDTQESSRSSKLYPSLSKFVKEMDSIYSFDSLLGTGDYVESGSSTQQWERFNAFVEEIPDMPILFSAGNHDLKRLNHSYSALGEQLDKNTSIPEEQIYKDGFGKYILFNAGGIDMIAISLGMNYTQEDIQWVSDVLNQHKDRVGILLTHEFLGLSGTVFDNGVQLLDNLKNQNSNLRLILCGHLHGDAVTTCSLDDNNEHFAQAILLNSQENGDKASHIQFLTVNPKDNTLRVQSYAVSKAKCKREQDFTIPFDLTGFSSK